MKPLRFSDFRSSLRPLPTGFEFRPHTLQQQLEGGAPAGGDPAKPAGGDPAKPEFVTVADFQATSAQIRTMGDMLKRFEPILSNALTADKLVEFGLFEKDEAGTYKPKAAAAKEPEKKAPRDESDPVVQRVKALEKQLADERAAKEASEKARLEQDRDSALMSALTEGGAVNPKRDFIHLREAVARGDAGYTGKGKDKYGNDIEVKLSDLVTEYLDKNPELKRATNTGGGGNPTGNQNKAATAPNGAKVIPRAQWSDMNFLMANKAKFDSGEWQRGAE